MASVASQLIEEVTAHTQSDSLEDAREICADGIYFPNNLRVCIYIYIYIYIYSYHCDINVQTMIQGLTTKKPVPLNRLMRLDSCCIVQGRRHLSFFLPKRPGMLWDPSSHQA